jgi:hypothetical protein
VLSSIKLSVHVSRGRREPLEEVYTHEYLDVGI